MRVAYAPSLNFASCRWIESHEGTIRAWMRTTTAPDPFFPTSTLLGATYALNVLGAGIAVLIASRRLTRQQGSVAVSLIPWPPIGNRSGHGRSGGPFKSGSGDLYARGLAHARVCFRSSFTDGLATFLVCGMRRAKREAAQLRPIRNRVLQRLLIRRSLAQKPMECLVSNKPELFGSPNLHSML